MKLGLGLGFSGGGTIGYSIIIAGVAGGSFNETTGTSGVIGTATSNIGGTITWSIVAGSDARISINSLTGAVSTSSAIFSGDSAAFTVRADNGTLAIEFPFTAVGTVAGYETESTALFARFTSDPGTTRKGQINTLIAALKTAGVWAKLDCLWLMAAHDSQAAGLNWKSTSFTLTPTNSPTFTTDRGYQGNGSSSYIATGFNPTTASSPNYVRDSAVIGFWSRSNVNDSLQYDIGAVTGAATGLNSRSSIGNTLRGFVNTTTSSNYGAASDSLGHFALSRTASNLTTGYQNGSSLGTTATASSAVVNSAFDLMRHNTGNFSTRQQAAAYFGGGLNSTEMAALHSALNTYLVAVGAA